MQFREITNEKEWERALKAVSFRPFAQSFAWGEFQASLGKRVRRFFIEDGNEVMAAVQLIFEKRPFVGGYWFAPKGPVFVTEQSRKKSESILRELQAYAKKEWRDGVFLRVEPMIEGDLPSGWERKKSFNPSSTRRLDLGRSEDGLLRDMHQKTRYNIRVAEKKGVEVALAGASDMSRFLNLMKETAERGAFLQREDDYLRNTFAALEQNGMARLRIASYEGEMIAGQLEIWYGDTVTYLYGASASDMRNVMAPYALHWTAINEAKAAGMRWYDFWGENPADAKSIDFKKSWSGISRFKAGFGGEHVEFAGTFDTSIRAATYRLLKILGRI